MPRTETLQAGLEAVSAMMTVLAGDGRRDRGLRLGEAFLRLLIDECNATAEPRLREAV